MFVKTITKEKFLEYLINTKNKDQIQNMSTEERFNAAVNVIRGLPKNGRFWKT